MLLCYLIFSSTVRSESHDASQFSAAALGWSYLEPIGITHVEPTKGPVAGGTTVLVSANGLGVPAGADPGTLRCKFELEEVVATPVRRDLWACVTPPAAVGWADLELTSNNADFTASGWQFEYEAVELLSSYPINAPCDGGGT